MIAIVPLESEPFDVRYNVAIFAIGYEKRSSFAVRCGLRADLLIGIPFDSNQVLSFNENIDIARRASAVIAPAESAEIRDIVSSAFDSAESNVGSRAHIRIAVDISSFTRSRLADILFAVFSRSRPRGRVSVDFIYSPAEYAGPPESSVGAITMGTVASGYSGTLRRSSLPLTAVFGLGYEPQLAVGAYEMLEPSVAWGFRPIGLDSRFGPAVDLSNDQLYRVLHDDKVVDYRLDDPLTLVSNLESLVYAMSADSRIVLIPMGPKLFALACLLVSLGEREIRPAVWRIGQVDRRHPSQVVEDGRVVGLSVEFRG